ncbi:MAG: 1-acylglycerol-3-phosphate O-acyltransferase [Erysipelotrichales bacterium]
MKDKIRLLKYFKALVRYHFKASRALKKEDELVHNKVLKDLSNMIIKSTNKNEIEIINKEVLANNEGAILLSNHQDNLDIFLLIKALDKPIRFVAKKELFKIPLFQNYMKLSHSYLLDREDPRQGLKVLKNVIKDVNNDNKNVVIFPEGTRSKASLMSSFNTGLFNVIRKSKKPIIPVYINNSFSNKNKIFIVFGNPIYPSSFNNLKPIELKEKVYHKITLLKKNYIKDIKKYRILGLGDSITFGELYNQTYDKGYYYRFIEQLNNEGMLESTYNFSIPGSRIKDVSKLIDNNNYQEKVKDIVYSNIDEEFLSNLLQQDVTIENAIKNSDILLFTCGANDILEVVSNYKIKKEDQLKSFLEMKEKLRILFNKIRSINPNIKIIFFGQYFPYPHIKSLLKYNYIDILDKYLKELDNNKDIFYISLNAAVLENKESFLLDRKNIHLSNEGYIYMNRLLSKLFQEKIEHKL